VDVKRILRYIVGTANLGLTHRKSADGQRTNKLNASADADHDGTGDRRSFSGWFVMLNGTMISWASKRQPVGNSDKQYRVRVLLSVSMCCGMIVFAEAHGTNRIYTELTDSHNTGQYKVRELSCGDNPEVKLWKIDGTDQPSDIFTKALPRVSFERHRSTIMVTVI
jgi:hypothetical protein